MFFICHKCSKKRVCSEVNPRKLDYKISARIYASQFWFPSTEGVVIGILHARSGAITQIGSRVFFVNSLCTTSQNLHQNGAACEQVRQIGHFSAQKQQKSVNDTFSLWITLSGSFLPVFCLPVNSSLLLTHKL